MNQNNTIYQHIELVGIDTVLVIDNLALGQGRPSSRRRTGPRYLYNTNVNPSLGLVNVEDNILRNLMEEMSIEVVAIVGGACRELSRLYNQILRQTLCGHTSIEAYWRLAAKGEIVGMHGRLASFVNKDRDSHLAMAAIKLWGSKGSQDSTMILASMLRRLCPTRHVVHRNIVIKLVRDVGAGANSIVCMPYPMGSSLIEIRHLAVRWGLWTVLIEVQRGELSTHYDLVFKDNIRGFFYRLDLRRRGLFFFRHEEGGPWRRISVRNWAKLNVRNVNDLREEVFETEYTDNIDEWLYWVDRTDHPYDPLAEDIENGHDAHLSLCCADVGPNLHLDHFDRSPFNGWNIIFNGQTKEMHIVMSECTPRASWGDVFNHLYRGDDDDDSVSSPDRGDAQRTIVAQGTPQSPTHDFDPDDEDQHFIVGCRVRRVQILTIHQHHTAIAGHAVLPPPRPPAPGA